MNPPNHTPSPIAVPEFCLPATKSGTSMLVHILRSSKSARKNLEIQRRKNVVVREDTMIGGDSEPR